MEPINDLDRKILFELDRNARASLSILSQRLKIGRDRLAYRLKGMRERGLLKRCTVTIDPYRFGLCVYKTYLILDTDRVRRQALLDVLQMRPDIYWYAETDGAWDVMFGIYARSPYEFYLLQDSILDQFQDIIRGVNFCTLIEAYFFRKQYLVGAGSNFFKIGGKPENHRLDSHDLELLSLLAEDARMPITELGERIGASSTLVNSRIERMEKNNIIVGYRTELDLSQLGMLSFKARLFLSSHNSDAVERLIDYARLNPYLMYIIRQLGDCKLELELEVRDYEHYMLMINDIKERFPRLIRHVDTLSLKNQTYKWMPLESHVDVEAVSGVS